MPPLGPPPPPSPLTTLGVSSSLSLPAPHASAIVLLSFVAPVDHKGKYDDLNFLHKSHRCNPQRCNPHSIALDRMFNLTALTAAR